MNMEEMGRVYQYLLKFRVVESKPVAARRGSRSDVEYADILTRADHADLERFREFLGGQGLQLLEYDDSYYGGIAAGGRVWLLTRGPEGVMPSFLTTHPITESMRLRDNEPKQTSLVWFLHIWLIYLSLVYTRTGRGISEVSSYQNSLFHIQALIDAVHEHVENIRNIGIERGAEEKVFTILDAERGMDISRRVRSFVTLMTESRLLINVGEDECQQSLLGAVEMAVGYDRTMRHYLRIEDAVLQNIVNIMAPTSQATAMEAER